MMNSLSSQDIHAYRCSAVSISFINPGGAADVIHSRRAAPLLRMPGLNAHVGGMAPVIKACSATRRRRRLIQAKPAAQSVTLVDTL
jgi:hypothetical protein